MKHLNSKQFIENKEKDKKIINKVFEAATKGNRCSSKLTTRWNRDHYPHLSYVLDTWLNVPDTELVACAGAVAAGLEDQNFYFTITISYYSKPKPAPTKSFSTSRNLPAYKPSNTWNQGRSWNATLLKWEDKPEVKSAVQLQSKPHITETNPNTSTPEKSKGVVKDITRWYDNIPGFGRKNEDIKNKKTTYPNYTGYGNYRYTPAVKKDIFTIPISDPSEYRDVMQKHHAARGGSEDDILSIEEFRFRIRVIYD